MHIRKGSGQASVSLLKTLAAIFKKNGRKSIIYLSINPSVTQSPIYGLYMHACRGTLPLFTAVWVARSNPRGAHIFISCFGPTDMGAWLWTDGRQWSPSNGGAWSPSLRVNNDTGHQYSWVCHVIKCSNLIGATTRPPAGWEICQTLSTTITRFNPRATCI